ncbi:MAG: hypothetical protein Salg2KO_05910 [Salibacteraceae bacterium]
MHDPRRIGKGFDILAPIYDACVWLIFGNSLTKFQSESIVNLESVDVCAIVGGGTGKILQTALARNMAKKFYYVEASPRMHEMTKKRLDSLERSHVHHVYSIEEINESVNLILFPFILDCYTDESVKRLLASAASRLSERGKIVVMDFNAENIGAMRPKWRQRMFISILYIPFRMVGGVQTSTLPKIDTLLRSFFTRVTITHSIRGGWIMTWLASKE